MTLADCVQARSYLLEEPTKLLLEIARQFAVKEDETQN